MISPAEVTHQADRPSLPATVRGGRTLISRVACIEDFASCALLVFQAHANDAGWRVTGLVGEVHVLEPQRRSVVAMARVPGTWAAIPQRM